MNSRVKSRLTDGADAIGGRASDAAKSFERTIMKGGTVQASALAGFPMIVNYSPESKLTKPIIQ
jgi:hypothetical protein